MTKHKYEDSATEGMITRLQKGGMSDKDIEASGVYKFKADDDPNVNSVSWRAKRIMSKAIGNWRGVKKPAALTQKRKYTNPVESE
jgi:hypothetical protein